MKLDHIVILLSDLQQCIKFYDTLLPLIGFTKDRSHVFKNDSGIYLDFRQATDTSQQYQRFASGLNHLGFTALEREDIVQISQTMADAGFDVPEIQEFDVGSAIFLKDLDGMRVELTYYSAS